MIELTVPGVAAPQGSKRHVGRGVLIESSKALKPWREKVNGHYLANGHSMIPGAVIVQAIFVMPRPKGHYGTGRNADTVKARFVDMPHTSKPDGDKLIRAIFDALSTTKTQRGAIEDDSHVVYHTAKKRYVREWEEPHAHVIVRAAPH